MKRIFIIGLIVSSASVLSAAPASSKPTGFRFFNNHLTVKPYVSVSYTYNSNVDSDHDKENADSIISLNPGVDFAWQGDRWQLAGNLWYRWNNYCRNQGRMGANNFGESLAYSYTTADSKGGKGWSLLIDERYSFISQSDSLNGNSGRGIWRDRDNIDADIVLEERFTERLHASASGQLNYLHYHNETGNYAPMYGWTRLSAGLEAGYVFSKWTDLIIAGGYSHYNQDRGAGSAYTLSRSYSDNTDSWTVQGGFGTHLTEKITYRILGGASWVNYGNAYNDRGFTYSATANWRITRTFQTSLMGSSYYQPSEYTLGSAQKVYTLSWGLSYLTLGDRLTLTGDVAYRHYENAYSDAVNRRANWGSSNQDSLQFRLGGTYTFNRWVSIFASLGYDVTWYATRSESDYDRFIGTLGLRFHY